MKFGTTAIALAFLFALVTPVGAVAPTPEAVTEAEQWFVYDANPGWSLTATLAGWIA